MSKLVSACINHILSCIIHACGTHVIIIYTYILHACAMHVTCERSRCLDVTRPFWHTDYMHVIFM